MIPNQFTYKKAHSLDDALSLLKEHGDDAKLLAGGHSLIPALKLRLNDPAVLIDVSSIDALSGIEEKGGHVVIGAMVTHGEIVDSALVKEKISFFSEAADLIGDVQVRNRGTIGGSIAHADPAADWPALLLASESVIHIQGDGGSREVAAEDFFQGLYQTALEDSEIITAISVPIREGSKSTYVKFMQPASRFAIVGCAALVSNDGVRVAFSGVSAKPFRDKGVENALNGSLSEATIAEATAQAAEGVSVLGDHYASEGYRKQMAKVYCKRALTSLL